MHTTVIDLGFGDAGKGTIVDALARWNPNTSAVVRFSGGAQSAHNVVTDDGRHHTFAQFGAATFVPGVRTFLGPEFLLNPGNLWREEQHLHEVGVKDAMVRLSIHPDALVITPYHQLLNQLKGSAHGTTGQGIGETMSDSLRFGDDQVIRARDLLDQKLLVAKTRNVKDRKVREARSLGLSSLGSLREDKEFFEHCQWVVDCGCVRNTLRDLANDGDLIFEGSQGVLLDQDYGFHPHTTWGSTIRTNARMCWRVRLVSEHHK